MSEPADVEAVRAELADVARQIARLLAQPRYDEAELAELDVRASALREHLRAYDSTRRELWEWKDARHSGGLTSGG